MSLSKQEKKKRKYDEDREKIIAVRSKIDNGKTLTKEDEYYHQKDLKQLRQNRKNVQNHYYNQWEEKQYKKTNTFSKEFHENSLMMAEDGSNYHKLMEIEEYLSDHKKLGRSLKFLFESKDLTIRRTNAKNAKLIQKNKKLEREMEDIKEKERYYKKRISFSN